MHAARLAALEAALCALLRAHQDDSRADSRSLVADGISASLDAESLSIEYTMGGMPVAGEGV